MRARIISAAAIVVVFAVAATAAVAGAPSAGVIRAVKPIEGKRFDGRIADFSGIPHEGFTVPTATIDWGDGSELAAGQVVAGAGAQEYTVFGAHTYAHARHPTVNVVLYYIQDIERTEGAAGEITVRRDTIAPVTKLRLGPDRVAIVDRTPTFRFGSSELGSRYRCSLDHRRFHPCSSPFTTRQLGFGEHLLEVRAVDRFRNIDLSPYGVVFDIFRLGKAPECPNNGVGAKATIWRNPILFSSLSGRPINGTEGDDVIVGTATYGEVGAGRDQIYGLGGADHICGYGGRDYINGGGGPDRIETGVAPPDSNANQLDSARFIGEEGNDELIGSEGGDRIYGGAGSDRIVGRSGKDLLSGQADSDTILGLDGADRVYGGTEGDQLQGNAGNDLVSGGDGLDFLWGDRLTSTEGDLSNLPEFAAGNDKLVGNEGPDGLDGGPFSDDCEIDPNDLYRDNCEGIAFP